MASTNVLIVIDPTSENHPGHATIADLAARKKLDYNFTLLLAVDTSGVDTAADNEKVLVDAELITELESPLKNLSESVTTRISWSHEWTESILNAAKAADTDFIFLSHPGKSKPQFADEYWKLIRTTNKPLIIVNPNRSKKTAKVLMAMDLQDDHMMERNKRIHEAAARAAELWDAELHLVNAYSDSSHYPDRGRIVSLSGLPNENVHIVQAEPDEALRKVTNELNPMLLVLGATRRNTGIRAALRGVKVAQMFNRIEHDVMIVT